MTPSSLAVLLLPGVLFTPGAGVKVPNVSSQQMDGPSAESITTGQRDLSCPSFHTKKENCRADHCSIVEDKRGRDMRFRGFARKKLSPRILSWTSMGFPSNPENCACGVIYKDGL
jgi:hypothetical protein